MHPPRTASLHAYYIKRGYEYYRSDSNNISCGDDTVLAYPTQPVTMGFLLMYPLALTEGNIIARELPHYLGALYPTAHRTERTRASATVTLSRHPRLAVEPQEPCSEYARNLDNSVACRPLRLPATKRHTHNIFKRMQAGIVPATW